MVRLWTVDQEVVGSNTTTHEINLYRELLYQVYSADLVKSLSSFDGRGPPCRAWT